MPIDVRDWHTYSADWGAERVDWYVDDRHVRTVAQSPTYPLQLMLGIYEFRANGPDERRPSAYPKVFEVDFARGFQAQAPIARRARPE